MALLLKLTFIRIEVYFVGFFFNFFLIFFWHWFFIIVQKHKIERDMFFFLLAEVRFPQKQTFGFREVWLGSTLRITVGGREWKGQKQDESEGKADLGGSFDFSLSWHNMEVHVKTDVQSGLQSRHVDQVCVALASPVPGCGAAKELILVCVR